jgi:RsiW-degrading membrane proteinase PrsW (M82 family)
MLLVFALVIVVSSVWMYRQSKSKRKYLWLIAGLFLLLGVTFLLLIERLES